MLLSEAKGVEGINRKGFMAELRSLLAYMDPEDRERALRCYELLFDRAGEAGEEELLGQLGSPIRQVLEVDREYRRAKKEGKIIYSEELPNRIPETDEMIPAEKEDAPEDLGQTLREAAAALEEYAREEAGPEDTEADAEEDLFPIADLEFPEAPLPEDDGPAPAGEEEEAEADPLDLTDREEEAPAPEDGEPVPEAIDSAPEEDSEVERIMRFASISLDENEEKRAEKLADMEYEKPGPGRVFAAVLVTLPVILLWAAGLALSLVLGVVMMAVGFVFCAAGVYFAGYAVNGYVAYMPDLLLVCGGALGCFALALFFLWLGLWFVAGGIAALARITGRIYRGILNRNRWEDEDDE